ncbi:hypothetical protein HU200_000373 [Digitaria exilis]|uniref:Uncharacterized protein n=1 Tax=Digitaria exilis TaxID=1010633 RepID=A0A835G330_9POAL|nr:hypothetical protein HU200_000373 [Digitaria exilis]
MQALLLPARAAPPPAAAAAASILRQHAVSASACAWQVRRPLCCSSGSLSCGVRATGRRRPLKAAAAPSSSSSSPGPLYPTPPPSEQEVERVKLEQNLFHDSEILYLSMWAEWAGYKEIRKTARYFKNLGTLGFWSQLVCTIVSGGILSFSTVVTGKVTAPFTFYATAAGIAAALFQSSGHLVTFVSRKGLKDLQKNLLSFGQIAPPRADVVKSLRNGIVLNILGMGAAVLGMQATVGALVAKALTTSTVPYYQANPGQSPVLALDVFLVQSVSMTLVHIDAVLNLVICHHEQASANTILSHFLGLASTLELLRSVSLPPAEGAPSPAPARA